MGHYQNIEDFRDLSNHAGIIYTFLSERGRQDLSYEQYLSDTELRSWIKDDDRYQLILGRTIFTYTNEYLVRHEKTRASLRDIEEEVRKNRFRFFAPSGRIITDFLNDFENDLCILVAPNRIGKTQTNIIKKILSGIPCDPTWEIFTKHGVKYRPFRGPQKIGLASYDFGFHRDTTLPMLLDWLPTRELGVYAKDYKGKGAKQVNLNNIPMLPLTCGTQFFFLGMAQSQTAFEGNLKHQWGWDEQGTEAAFNGADVRTSTIRNSRHDFSLTPHKVEGRPDTGAGTWINALVDGRQTKGRKVKVYNAEVWDAPDWIYPEESKAREFKKLTELERNNDTKGVREQESRFFGKWHESSGLVIDEWDSAKHVIEPFEIPKHWTRFRGLDHGSKHPAACLWAAVNPGGDIFFYRDYLRTGRVPSQISKEIIELSGNKRKKIGTYRNPKTDQMYDRYIELQCGEAYQWTVFDARAFSQTSAGDGIKLSKLYDMAGLKVSQGSGKASEAYVPLIKEWFVVDPDKPHFVTGEPGAPRVYVFSTCVEFIRTIKRWVWEERKTKSTERMVKESPTKKDDDLCDCMKLILQKQPRFRGNPLMSDKGMYDDSGDFDEPSFIVGKPGNSLTGY